MSELPHSSSIAADASSSALPSNDNDNIEWEEEEEEVKEISRPSMQHHQKEEQKSAFSTSSTTPPSRAALIAHLRHLLRPFGSLTFSLATTVEPSIVPLPPRTLYPAHHQNENKNNNRKRAAEFNPDDEYQVSAEEYYRSVRDLKALPLVRFGQCQPVGSDYNPQLIASTMQLTHASNALTADLDALSDPIVLARISVVESFFHSTRGYSSFTSPQSKRLWMQHEWHDPYRLVTHPPLMSDPNDRSVPARHPGDAKQEEERYQAFIAAASTATSSSSDATVASPISLHLPHSASFLSSHIAVSMGELDSLHSLFTTPRERTSEAAAQAAKQPPATNLLFRTFVDLSGGEGSLSEFIMFRRRAVNLRARGWGYDLSGNRERKNWSVNWKNKIAIEQAKNLDVYYPQYNADATPSEASAASSSSPSSSSTAFSSILSQLTSEQSIDAFMRNIDAQTKGVGVNLALAGGYAPLAGEYMEYHAVSQSYRPKKEYLYVILLFQVDTALRTLAAGGNLVLQLYETHSPFVQSVIYLLFQLFDSCILQQLAGTIGYGSGQSYLLCQSYRHDRLKIRPSAFPVIAALRQAKSELQKLSSANPQLDYSSYSLMPPYALRFSQVFIQWLKKYNQLAHEYQLHCMLSLLQPTALQPKSLLDYEENDVSDSLTLVSPSNAASSSSSNNDLSFMTEPIYPLPPAHHRIRISMLQYTGLPVHDPFMNQRITRL